MDAVITASTATALAALIAARAVSAVEVVEAHLRRIAEVNPRDQRGRRARRRARAGRRACGATRRPSRGPLHGVPFTVKDNISAAGLPMAIGAPERAGVVPDADATVVARLKRRAAILLGKTNCPPYGGGIETDNEVYGRTSNPYDLVAHARAGAAAARRRSSPRADRRAGSAPTPARACGCRPTSAGSRRSSRRAQRVPVTGVLDDEGQIGALGDPRTQVGALARSVADVALLLRLVAGPDGRDGGVAPVPLGDPADDELRGLRVAVHTENGLAEPTRATVEAVERGGRVAARRRRGRRGGASRRAAGTS